MDNSLRTATRYSLRIRVYALLIKWSPMDRDMVRELPLRGRRNLGFDDELLAGIAIDFTRLCKEYGGEAIGPGDMAAQTTVGDVLDLTWSRIPQSNKSE